MKVMLFVMAPFALFLLDYIVRAAEHRRRMELEQSRLDHWEGLRRGKEQERMRQVEAISQMTEQLRAGQTQHALPSRTSISSAVVAQSRLSTSPIRAAAASVSAPRSPPLSESVFRHSVAPLPDVIAMNPVPAPSESELVDADVYLADDMDTDET